MTKSLSLATISALLLAACIINTDDDDGNNDTSGNSTTNSTTASTTNSSTTAGTGESTDGTTVSTTVSSETLGESTAADSGSSSTGAGGSCGWGATGEKTTPMGYVCDGDGADPDMMIDMDCAAYDVELVEQGDCGGKMGITGAGCCDANGNVWYCADDAGTPRLFTEAC